MAMHQAEFVQIEAGAGRMLLGRSPAVRRLWDQVQRIAPADISVLVTGETGTGKELVARIVHQLSQRRTRDLVALDCNAVALLCCVWMSVPLADRLIDEFGDRREVDLIKDYTRRYTFLVMSTLLGVSVDDEERLLQLVYALLQGGSIVGADTPENRRRAALVAVAEMNEFLRPIVEDRRKTPRDDIISYLLASEIDGQPLSETVLFDYIRFLYPAGAETTHLVMGRMMNNILSDLSVRDRLVANPADRAAAVEEALRFSPGSNLIPRTLERDTEVCDVTIPAGSTVLFSVTSGNRDPAVFPEPEQFSIDQKRKQLLSFGIGPHFCIGSHLAKAELAVSLGRLLDRLPGLRLKEQAPPAMGTVFRWIPSLHVRFDTVNPAP